MELRSLAGAGAFSFGIAEVWGGRTIYSSSMRDEQARTNNNLYFFAEMLKMLYEVEMERS